MPACGPRSRSYRQPAIAIRADPCRNGGHDSLYPLLYRLEKERWIEGRWVEKPGERRRRFYGLTAEGKRQLEAQRRGWGEFVRAVSAVAGVEYA